MSSILQEYEKNERVIEPEVVEMPRWRRFSAHPRTGAWIKFKMAFGVGLAGLILCLLGTLLTLSIVGLFVGLPLLAAGVGLLLLAVFMVLSPSRTQAVTFRFPSAIPNEKSFN